MSLPEAVEVVIPLQLLHEAILSDYVVSLKKSRASTGIESMIQRYTNRAMKPSLLGAGQFVCFICT